MKDWSPVSAVRWLFASEPGATNGLLPRWIFLRALGLIYYSAFFSLVFQIKGLIGPQGILPAGEYLHAVTGQFGRVGYWYAPTLLWLSSGRHMLTAICWVGMIASLLLVLDLRSEEHTSELQSRQYLVCRLLLEKKKKKNTKYQR